MATWNITKDFVAGRSTPGEYSDSKLTGFIFRVGASGVKSYLVRSRFSTGEKAGEKISYTIGRDGPHLTATDARKKAEEALSLIKLGEDPRHLDIEREAERKAKEAQIKAEKRKDAVTLRKVLNQWCQTSEKTKDSTKELYGQMIGKHLKDWLDMPIAEITADMVEVRYQLVAKETVASANNTFRALRRMLNWQLDRQYFLPPEQKVIHINPVRILKDSWKKVEPRDQFISKADLPFWFAEVESLENPMYSDFFQLLLVTGLRLSEAAGLKVSDCDFENRVFTCIDTKNRKITPYL